MIKHANKLNIQQLIMYKKSFIAEISGIYIIDDRIMHLREGQSINYTNNAMFYDKD